MGFRFKTCGLLASFSRKEIISEKALRAVVEIVHYLKLNVDNRNLFRESGYRRRVRNMAAYIASGNKHLTRYLLERNPVEAAAGLQYYLLRLPKPLIPKYVQDLALDADDSVQPEMVAADMLGLIRQDLRGRHLYLVAVILDLLSFLRKHAINDELVGSSVPVTLLPVFITQPYHMPSWRRVANVFMEMVDLSPSLLPPPSRPRALYAAFSSSTAQRIQQRNILMDEINIQQEEILREADQVILHQIFIRDGSEGDASFGEIININRLRQRIYPKMLNPIFGYFLRRFR